MRKMFDHFVNTEYVDKCWWLLSILLEFVYRFNQLYHICYSITYY